MMALSAAERQRRCRLKRKVNSEKYEEYLRKAREHYHTKKLLVKDMNVREKRLANRKWRIKQKKRRDTLKEQQRLIREYTPPLTPPSSPNVSSGRKKLRRDRSRLYRANLKLKEDNNKWRRKYETWRKRFQRTRSLFGKYEHLCQAIQEKYSASKSRKERKIIKEIMNSKIIKKSDFRKTLGIEALGVKSIRIRNRGVRRRDLVKKIQEFFLRDDVSRATAGKKETVTKNKIKRQKRFLLDTMKNVYQYFKKETYNTRCSYGYFVKNRPFYVVPPSTNNRDTCLCKQHINIHYKLMALKKKRAVLVNDMSSVLESMACDVTRMECMYGICTECRDKKATRSDNLNLSDNVSWSEWVRTTETITKDNITRKIAKNVKELQHGELSDLINKFENELLAFKKHVFRVRIQHQGYRKCIDNLTSNSIALHMDFSENYNCKYSEEIQAHHFGGSRNQLSLHTVVMYIKPKDNEVKQCISFCTVSSSLAHSPAAIWAHLDPILKLINEEHPYLDTIHFFSDGPCTQYRQKQNFYLMTTKLFEDYGFKKMTWSFFEAGHGKGAADGIGGLIKRTADRMVLHGRDIRDVTQFYELLNGATNVKLFIITQNAIEKISKILPKNLSPIPATMRLHHISSYGHGQLSYSDLSCFCNNGDSIGFCSCLKNTVYNFHPSTENMDIDVTTYHDLKNICAGRKRTVYKTFYEDSDISDSEHSSNICDKENCKPNNGASTSTSIDKNIIHPKNIPIGTFLLVTVPGEKKKHYNYACITQSDFEDGEIKVMFLRCVDETKCIFRPDEMDVSFIEQDDIIKILDNPSLKTKRRGAYYHFCSPIEEVFEK